MAEMPEKPDLDVVARAALDFSHLYGPHGGDVTPAPAAAPPKETPQEPMRLDPLARAVLDFSHIYGAQGGAWQKVKDMVKKAVTPAEPQRVMAAESTDRPAAKP